MGGAAVGVVGRGCGRCLGLFWLRNPQVAANLDGQVVADFAVSWNGASPVCAGMAPPGMTATIAQQHAIVRHEMGQ